MAVSILCLSRDFFHGMIPHKLHPTFGLSELLVSAARCATGRRRPGPGPQAQGPPKGQSPGSGPDPDALVVTDDHDIPRVSDNPKSIPANLNLSNLIAKGLPWVLLVLFSRNFRGAILKLRK